MPLEYMFIHCVRWIDSRAVCNSYCIERKPLSIRNISFVSYFEFVRWFNMISVTSMLSVLVFTLAFIFHMAFDERFINCINIQTKCLRIFCPWFFFAHDIDVIFVSYEQMWMKMEYKKIQFREWYLPACISVSFEIRKKLCWNSHAIQMNLRFHWTL